MGRNSPSRQHACAAGCCIYTDGAAGQRWDISQHCIHPSERERGKTSTAATRCCSVQQLCSTNHHQPTAAQHLGCSTGQGLRNAAPVPPALPLLSSPPPALMFTSPALPPAFSSPSHTSYSTCSVSHRYHFHLLPAVLYITQFCKASPSTLNVCLVSPFGGGLPASPAELPHCMCWLSEPNTSKLQHSQVPPFHCHKVLPAPECRHVHAGHPRQAELWSLQLPLLICSEKLAAHPRTR